MERELTDVTCEGRQGSRPRVLLDCDGVLADFVGRYLSIVNSQNGTSFKHDDVTDFDIAASLRLTDKQRFAVEWWVGLERFAGSLEPLPGAGAGVRRLQEIAEVYIVTSPWDSSRTWEHDRKAWLRTWFGIEPKHVISTRAKHVCSGDVLVDDKTSTCVKWQAAHPRGIAVQWQTPHNRRDGWSGPSTDSWESLLGMVARFAGGAR